ncbi:hypothetical protein dsat_1765 [Alkalidesulfovibrio alkalitolerans DSM 16529]|jgi:hypothetical protein|uniref:Holin of 3TMs, for gene-transfer release n=1 Tax=Alkalidesulfovibrio alkalitolerans DSM 16529 TaxID=1121439 RepID=S7TG98_9BACT|nr:hypothetical protein [Alkalidesulfovibrio alkalitolerans]EPR36237.1 hypothetical protein dsat_1765 [Alkalidesulfovibrio alkalitolerans DSM 16529]
MDPITIIAGVASVVPTIARWIGGDKSKTAEVAQKAADVAMRVTGASDPATAIEQLKINKKFALEFEKLWAGVDMGLQESLTRRHEADMSSDSWLSKNVRPLCLLGLTAAVVGGVFTSVDEGKLRALTELGLYVFGYYFIGRSAFDKGAVRLDLSREGGGAVR